MGVTIFLHSTSDARTREVLKSFAKGISKYTSVEVSNSTRYTDCDTAVFFGSWKDRPNPHHVLKRDIIANTDNFIVIETPLIGRGPVSEVLKDTWYRIGHGGFLRDTGKFNNDNCPADRWNTISRQLGLTYAEWNRSNSSGPIVVALQLPGDASLRGKDISLWCHEVCYQLSQNTDRQIIVRYPQLKRQYNEKLMTAVGKIDRVEFQAGTKENLEPTLKKAWCTVTYSSGLGVDSILAGTPTIACDPGNFAWDVSEHNLSKIETPKRPSTYNWLHNLAYTQWNDNEIAKGLPWEHLNKYV